MAKRTIEIDDVLPDCVENAIEDVECRLRDYIAENPGCDVPCLSNDLDHDGRIHEIVDGAVPIWDSQIDAAWFLYRRELEQAYENAGVGRNPRENNGMAAIYYYIHERVEEWYAKNAEAIVSSLRHGDCSSDKQ